MRRAIDVAAGLIFRNGRLLLAQRQPDAHLGGLWEFPGGKREPDETFPDCLRRELREELGIEVEVQDLVETVTHDYPEKRVHIRFYRCQLVAGEPAPRECAACRWVTREELYDYEFPAADAGLIAKLRHAWG